MDENTYWAIQSCWRCCKGDSSEAHVWKSHSCPVLLISSINVNFCHALVQEGFWYHHAEPNYLMLLYWLPQGPHSLPGNATHRVGVGAFVMNDRREVIPYIHHWNDGYHSAFKMCVSFVIFSQFSAFIVWLFPLQTCSWLIAEIIALSLCFSLSLAFVFSMNRSIFRSCFWILGRTYNFLILK